MACALIGGDNTTSFIKENDGLVLYVFFTHPVLMFPEELG
jgi:hypothetical protein